MSTIRDRDALARLSSSVFPDKVTGSWAVDDRRVLLATIDGLAKATQTLAEYGASLCEYYALRGAEPPLTTSSELSLIVSKALLALSLTKEATGDDDD